MSSVHVEHQHDWMTNSTFVSDVDEWAGNVSSVHVEQQYDWTANLTFLSNVDEWIGTVVSEGYTYWEPITNITRRSILVQDNMTYWKFVSPPSPRSCPLLLRPIPLTLSSLALWVKTKPLATSTSPKLPCRLGNGLLPGLPWGSGILQWASNLQPLFPDSN